MIFYRWIFVAIIFSLCSIELYSGLIITEVMENSIDDNYYEFIELYNNSNEQIDISSYCLTDGDTLDTIVSSSSSITSNLISDTTFISSHSYAVIINFNYIQGPTPYSIKDGATILTVQDGKIGNGLSGTSDPDPITIYDKNGEIVATYGTPKPTNKSTYLNADDDGFDLIPIKNVTKGFSVERIDYDKEDIESNWGVSISSTGNTIGGASSLIKKEEINTLKILINEISVSNDIDWIEFFVQEGSGSLKNFSCYEGNTLIVSFPNVVVNKGDYFVVQCAQDDNAYSKTNGCFVFNSMDESITATDNIITLKYNNNYVDAFCFSNNDSTWSQANDALIKLLFSIGMWNGNELKDTFICENSKGFSMSRKYNSNGGILDTNSKDDWELSRLSFAGAKNFIKDDFGDKSDILFFNRTFSPYGDYRYNTIKINYKILNNTTLDIKIYDVNLNLIRNLLNTNINGVDSVEWDGKNNYGNIAKVGIYIIYYEFIDKNSGILKKGKYPVILGKTL